MTKLPSTGYYSRWMQDRQTNHRDDMVSTEHHMQDLMSKYAIPSDTAYAQVASQENAGPGYNDRGDRDQDRDRGYAGRWQGRLSPDDQNKFNKKYAKWQEANAKHDRDDIDKHARSMDEIMMIRGNMTRPMRNGRATGRDAIVTTSPKMKARCKRSWPNTIFRAMFPMTC